MVVPQKRNHRGVSVGRERVSKRGSRRRLIHQPGRRRAPLRRRPTAAPRSVRQVRCSPAVDVVAPISAATPATATTRPLVPAMRIAMAPLTSRFRHASNPTKTPTKNPSVQVTASRWRALRNDARRRRERSHQAECPARPRFHRCKRSAEPVFVPRISADMSGVSAADASETISQANPKTADR